MRSVDDMELCPGSGNKPDSRSVCPVCDHVFKHTTFTKVTPTHRRWKRENEEE